MKNNYLSKSRYLLLFLFALIVGSGSAWADGKTLPYTFGFEDATEMANWTPVSCKDYGGNYGTGRYLGNANNGSYSFRFYYNSNPPQYIISPELATSANTVDMSFWYKTSGFSGPESFQVGYSTKTNDVSDFIWDTEVSTSTTTYTQYSKTYPAGTKYIAIKYTANDKYYLYIDDFSVSESEAYPKPQDFEFTGYTTNSATFNWTNGKDETAWQIAYSTTQGFDAGSVTPVDVTTKPYTLTGLTAETTYYARIRADYGSGNYSKWSDEISFKPSAAINTIVNDGTKENTYVPFHTNYTDGKIDKSQFIIPAASLSSIVDRQITKLTFDSKQASASFGTTVFKVYLKEVNVTSFENATFDYSDMEEVYSGSVSISGNEMAITLDEPFDYSGNNLKVGFEMTTKGSAPSAYNWYGIEVDGNASIYSYLYGSGSATSGLSSFLPKMTITSLPQVATVKKPKNLDDTATTTTTATLGWTNGSDETAWQIAYSTDTAFDPDTEGTKVTVNANPYTLTGLTAGTTYYAYIRAKKAEEYSDWSNKADFTTLSAVPVIELSATSHNFGLVSDADAQALTLTISNTGGAALTGLTVTPSAGFAVTDAEGNALTVTTIAASSTLIVKVKVNALGQQNGTITIDGNEIEAQQVTVSGYKLDDTKILETFASASSVSRWAVASGWTFNASTGAYSGTSSRTMTTPKISVSEGNVLALNVKLGWSGGSLIVEGLDADGNTVYDPVTYNSSNGGLNTSSYTLLTISDMPTTVAKVKLTGYYAYINVFNGFTYVNDPQLGLYSNEACTTVQASPATKNFGFAAEAQNQVYYLKNIGNGQIDLTIEQADGFTASVDDAALAEGEKATLTVTMTATEGLHDGTITVTAKNHDNDAVLGTFVVNANGGITGSKNNVVLTAFPAGWQNNNWSISSGAARIWSSTPSDLITTTLRVTAGDKLLVEAKKYYNTDDSQLSYSYSSDNGVNWSDPVSLTSSLGTDYKIVAISGIPAGDVLMKFTGTYAYIRQIYGFDAVAEPIMEFAADGTTKNFGMITSKTTSDAYTITNSGTALLDNLSVTCDNDNFEIAVADNATSIAAGSNVSFTVALKTTALGSQTGTVTISGDDVADKSFTVKGYVADNTKIFETFTAKPERWTNSTSPAWSFSGTGAYAGSYEYSGGYKYATLTSPKITVSEGQKLYISAKLSSNSSSYYVKVFGSSDNGSTWTAYTKTLTNDVLTNTDYTIVELDDVPTTVNKLQLVGYYVYVNGLNGFTYDDNDPEFGVFSDSEFASQITSGAATNAWGFINEGKTATYYIKNIGTGTMTLSKTDAPAGFTATLGETSLGIGESTTLVIAMENDAENNEGYHAGDVVLTAKDNADNTLGTFTVTSSGVVVGSKTDVNFTTLDAFPAGWDGGTYWSVTANTKATISYNSGILTTGTYTVAAGEKLAIEAKGNSSYTAPTLTYRYTTDNGINWTTGTSTLTYTYSASDYQIQAITDIPAAAAVKIEFTGRYVDIKRIYGYTAVLEPVMTLSPAATSYDFGMQTAAADYEITVTNSGTANMTNLAAALTGDDKDDFEVAVSKTTVPYTGENTATITVTLKASTEYKTHNATLTISADDLADKVITLSGKTRDADKWFVDFASEIPSSFVEKGAWEISSGAARTTASEENSLITQPINLAANEKIHFDAYNPYSGSLKVRYSVNGGISWSDYTDYTASINTSGSFSSHEIDFENDAAVTAIVEFKGCYYIQLDNIYGGTLNNTASMIKVTKSTAIVENGATEAFGSINAEATATYTITNVGNGTLTITDPVTKTGAAIATINATSLANGESATLTITMPVATPYEYKEGVVTVVTSLGDFIINYNDTILNPNALDEQFASGKPAGWYFGGYWKVLGAQAMQEDTGTAEDLITEQLAVAGTSDVLTFQAARTSSYSTPTFNVYTSQDRVTWTPVDLGDLTLTTSYRDVNISGLAAGDYYVKITGARVKVDNFLGWEKKNNTHDLYVTATSFPATTTKGNSATISATVTSLIAAESGVYAKLFIDGVQEGDAADAQDITLNGTNTFSFNYAIPENKTAQIKVYYSDNTEAFATALNAMKVNYTLNETVDPGAITAGTFNVTLTRTFIQGWNAVCLPFAIADIEDFFGAGAFAYSFTDYDNGTLSFTKEDAMVAATPYIVYVPEAIDSKSLNDIALTDAAAGVASDITANVYFRGTYAPVVTGGWIKNNNNDVVYGLTTTGKFAKAGTHASMKGFRAYFDVPGAAPVKGMSLFDGDDATSINGIAIEGMEEGQLYDLSGRRVNPATTRLNGIYILNGKKVLFK